MWIWVTVLENPDHVTLNHFFVIAVPVSPSFLDIFTFILLVLRIALRGRIYLFSPFCRWGELRLRCVTCLSNISKVTELASTNRCAL